MGYIITHQVRCFRSDNSMKHIEFMGPAGSGKSTLARKLVSEYNLFISRNELISRYFFPDQIAQSIHPYRVIKNLIRFGWSNHTRYKYFFDYCIYNPDFVSNTISYIQQQQGKQNKEILMMDVMSAYQLAQENLTSGEILVLDEGFYQKIAACAKHGKLPSNQYLIKMPNPDILVHVNPPIELARQRCKERDGTAKARKVYEQAKRTKEELTLMARDVGIQVIEVENKGEVSSTIDEIQSEISKNNWNINLF